MFFISISILAFHIQKKRAPKKCNICFCRNLLRKLIFHSNFQLLLCALALCRVPGDSIRPSLFKTYSEKRLKYLSTFFFVVYKPLKVGRWVCVVTWAIDVDSVSYVEVRLEFWYPRDYGKSLWQTYHRHVTTFGNKQERRCVQGHLTRVASCWLKRHFLKRHLVLVSGRNYLKREREITKHVKRP